DDLRSTATRGRLLTRRPHGLDLCAFRVGGRAGPRRLLGPRAACRRVCECGSAWPAGSPESWHHPDEGTYRRLKEPSMERRRLGRLGHDSSVLIYGAAALSEIDQDAADRSVQQALEAGI